MSIRLSNYDYSYANMLGSNFKLPLYKIISTTALTFASDSPNKSKTCRIAKIATTCFTAILLILPASFAWLIGKSISHLSSSQVNHDRLSLAPPPIAIPQEGENAHSINLNILSQKYNKLFQNEDNNLAILCDWTTNESCSIYRDNIAKRELFCKELSMFLRHLIKKMESGQLAPDKEKTILLELGKASTKCYPTWLEVAKKLFLEVNGQAETAEIKILRLIQEYKEASTLEFCQSQVDVQWHALSYVRNLLGKELGLDTTSSKLDPHGEGKSITFGKGLTKWIFLQKYENANRLVSAVQNMINMREFDQAYHAFLVEKVKARGMDHKSAATYVTENFFDDIEINFRGVNFILKEIGILK